MQTIFNNEQDGGVVAMAMTPDARYLATLSSGANQVWMLFLLSNLKHLIVVYLCCFIKYHIRLDGLL